MPIVCVVTHEERRAVDARRAGVPRHARAASGRRRAAGATTRRCRARSRRSSAQRGAGETGVARVMLDVHPWLVGRARRARPARSRGGQARRAARARDADGDAARPSSIATRASLPLPLPDAAALGAALDAEQARRRRVAARRVRARGARASRSTRRRAPSASRAPLADASEALAARHRREARRAAPQRVPRAARRRRDARRRGRPRGAQVVAARARARVRRGRARLRPLRAARACSCAACRAAASRSSARPRRACSACRSCASTSPRSSRPPRPSTPIHEATRAVEAVAPVVLWVDEIEKGLGAGRGDARHARVFGAFLTWLQERRAPVFVAATANEVERLPPELARRGRFDEVFFVDLPSPKERAQILGVHLRAAGPRTRRRTRSTSSRGSSSTGRARRSSRWSSAALFRAYAEKRELTEDAPARGGARARSARRRSTRRRSRRSASGGRRVRAARRPTGARSTSSATEGCECRRAPERCNRDGRGASRRLQPLNDRAQSTMDSTQYVEPLSSTASAVFKRRGRWYARLPCPSCESPLRVRLSLGPMVARCEACARTWRRTSAHTSGSA